MIELGIMVGQVDIVPELGSGLQRKSQHDDNGYNPKGVFFVLP